MSHFKGLSRAQKAAAILVAMGKSSAGRLLKFFKQDELKALIEAARTLKTIPQSELEKVVAEFEAEFAEGAGLLDSGDTMASIINETLSPDEINAIMEGTKAAVKAGAARARAAGGDIGKRTSADDRDDPRQHRTGRSGGCHPAIAEAGAR
jgi:flagellar motor switch protein FliG